MGTTIVERERIITENTTFGNVSLSFGEVVETFDYRNKMFALAVDYTIGFNDTYKHISNKRITDRVGVSDCVSFISKFSYRENMRINDIVANKLCKHIAPERFGITDSFSKTSNFNRIIAQNIGLYDRTKTKGRKCLQDSFLVLDTKEYGAFNECDLSFSEMLQPFVVSGFVIKTKKNSFERFRVRDSFSRNVEYNRIINDFIRINETAKKKVVRPLNEPVYGLTDSPQDNTFAGTQGTFSVCDLYSFASGVYLIVKKVSLEKVRLKDNVIKRSMILRQDNINMADGIGHEAKYKRSYSENVNVSEASCRKYSLNKKQNIGLSEDNVKNVSKKLLEAFRTNDIISKRALYRRVYTENCTLNESILKSPKKHFNEYASLYDSFIKPSGGVLSNIYIREGGVALNEFLNAANKISGYTMFSEFKVGEYEYKDAMVRISMTASDQVKPTAQEVTLHVDIPDTDDRGTAVITDTTSATQVAFNKSYYTVPEVQVTLRSASSSQGLIIPSIVNITKQYFEVQLMNTSNQLVQGSISWVAKGY